MHKRGEVLQIGFAFLRWNRRIAAMSRLTLALVVLALASATFAQSGTQVAPPDNSTQPDANSQGAPNASAPTVSSGVPPDSTSLIAIKTVKTVYPPAALTEKVQGQVMVKMVVSETGDVESAELVSGNAVLGKAAVEAAMKWKFRPYIRNGKPVKANVTLPFDFAFSDAVVPLKVPTKDGVPVATSRVKVAAGVTQGMIIHKISPTYPPEARRMSVQGSVVLGAIIGKDGRIKDLRVISGNSMLVDSAVGAVQQWRYRPYLIMGEPVEVDTKIVVNFTLSTF